MKQSIEKVGVIGAGIMGAGIAAHLANVGFETVLLDIVPPQFADAPPKDPKRNLIVNEGLKKAKKSKPAAFYLTEYSRRITTGNLEDDLHLLKDVDWVIEAIVERLDIKQSLFKKLESVVSPDTIITSNTSGISASAMCNGRSENFQKNFAITHFFNPPRYLKLIELVPGPKTDPSVMEILTQICEHDLGKGVVEAKDTPNFVGNRIGLYAIFAVIRAAREHGLSIEDVDALTGTLIGRSKSASFRTLDLVGLDTIVHAATNVFEGALDDPERDAFGTPELVSSLVAKNLLGDKTGSGFYKKSKDEKGKRVILSLDGDTLAYTPQSKTKFKTIATIKTLQTPKDKIKALFFANGPAGTFTFDHLARTLAYSASMYGEITDSIFDMDNAMKWGFAWKSGPFETWDQLGVQNTLQAMDAHGISVAPWVKQMLDNGCDSFYKTVDGELHVYDPKKGKHEKIPFDPSILFLPSLKAQNGIIEKNPGASLIDMGDGVACLEFHSKMNAIGDDVLSMIRKSVEIVERDFDGLVIGNHGTNFSVGANLPVLLFAAQEEEWDDVDWMIRHFQDALMTLKYCRRPVVAAPAGLALGGGCEVCLSSHRVRFAAETYMGLVEVGVGLIPAGGGCKEMIIRATENLFTVQKGGIYPSQIELKPFLARAFETLGMGKVAESGPRAIEIGLLRNTDQMTVNRDFLLYDAKKTIHAMNLEGFQPLEKNRTYRVAGRPLVSMLELALYIMRDGGNITQHDQVVGKALARVLCGGDLNPDTEVSEQYLLDLEREAFLGLIGTPATQARIEHILKTGKPLRN